ncbi:MAG: methionyl-tRNA formyltransferase [Bradymonadia bacterium]|jgi:methionyl-tRNA formyltransferase
MRYSVVFMGSPEYALPTLERLCDDERIDLRAVVTQADKEQGRGRRMKACAVKAAALERGLQVYSPVKLNTAEMREALSDLAPDFFVTIAYGKILRPSFLAIPKIAPLNLHASLLPKYRGAAPIAWSIINGEHETGVCLMRMDAGMDTGPVYARRSLPIADNDTAQSMHDKLSVLSAQILVDHIAEIAEGKLEAEPQRGEPSVAPMLTKQMGAIHFLQDAKQISCTIRGLSPWPSAFVRFGGKRLTLSEVYSEDYVHNAAAGSFLGYDKEQRAIRIACQNGVLGVRALKPEGKAWMDANSFVNGYRLQESAVFEKYDE